MPKVSRETASETITLEGVEVQLEHFDGGYSVCFESHTADADLAGYVAPGHTPVHYAGAELVEFSPADVLAKTILVVMDNLRPAAGAATSRR
jgi:hypothetical protein